MILMRCVEDAHHVMQCHGDSGLMLVLFLMLVAVLCTFAWCVELLIMADRLETAMKKLER